MMSCKHSYEKMVLKMIFQNFFSIVNGPEQYVIFLHQSKYIIRVVMANRSKKTAIANKETL